MSTLDWVLSLLYRLWQIPPRERHFHDGTDSVACILALIPGPTSMFGTSRYSINNSTHLKRQMIFSWLSPNNTCENNLFFTKILRHSEYIQISHIQLLYTCQTVIMTQPFAFQAHRFSHCLLPLPRVLAHFNGATNYFHLTLTEGLNWNNNSTLFFTSSFESAVGSILNCPIKLICPFLQPCMCYTATNV